VYETWTYTDITGTIGTIGLHVPKYCTHITYIHIYVVCVCVYIYIYIHTHTHTHTHLTGFLFLGL